jgi:glycosyltransferase involved in cell wall biosynthesis
MRRVPSVISLDATPINYDSLGVSYGHRPAGDGFLDHRKHALNRLAYESAAALVTWSEWARRSLVDDYGIDSRAVSVITPGAAPTYFDLGAARPNLPQRPASDRIRFLFVGGDFQRKGGPALLKAFQGRLSERCQLDLVTHASIPAQPNVRVHNGMGPNSPELLKLFADADVFVLPTRADCLALVLMEAAAAGLPVVATEVGALSEAFVPGGSGLLIPPHDVSALAKALTVLADDAELRRRMGRAGHSLANKRFDARRNNQALLNLVMDVAHDSPATRRAA